ncbi:condensin-2 complex subunit D3 [Etheostoma spectabile]|uniref:condensin-2 complex subunit D3 n=1 Tax=Etheostoma spectabile TaxID=54343 RepID=UPI0013AF4A39|nr:condensin-2 complex subunit D3-like [Etheostoma spectabile]
MSHGDRYTSSSYRKIFGDSPKFPVASSRMGSASHRGSPGLRAMAGSRNSGSSLSLYRRIGRSTSYSPVPSDSLDLTQTSVVNNEFKVIRTNEKEQLQQELIELRSQVDELSRDKNRILIERNNMEDELQMVESEFRSHGAQAVGMLTSQMASTDYACFIKWLFNYSRHSKMVCRLFSVDVVMVLLEQPERRPEECLDPELTCFLPHKFLIQSLLFARRMDDSPTVLACLAQCLELPSFNVTRAVHNLFSATGTQTVLEGEITEGGSQNSQKTYRTLPFRTVEMSTTDVSDCDAKENLALLLKRVKDLKTNVRKSALQALVGLLKHNVIPMSWENLAILSERCRDPAVSVKKKALQCIGELLTAKPECSVVQKAWLQGVVPAVVDSENSVQDKALEALDQVLLSQVKPYSASRHLDASQRLTWDLLGLLCHDCQNLSSCL